MSPRRKRTPPSGSIGHRSTATIAGGGVGDDDDDDDDDGVGPAG
jgi:hypothetical protein